LDAILQHGLDVYCIGKIYDIFAGKGMSKYVKTKNNKEGIQKTIDALSEDINGLIFTNLVDFDMHFGHRRDVNGYAKCLEEFDQHLPDILANLNEDDVLIITADHGNDPTWRGTDHTREYIPILISGTNIIPGINIGIRNTFADIAATIAQLLNIPFDSSGTSFGSKIYRIPYAY
jgi:phosphopentomutase